MWMAFVKQSADDRAVADLPFFGIGNEAVTASSNPPYCQPMESDKPEPIVIPHRELSADALRGVLESFVLREGTEYGERDVSLDEKVAQVLNQLERGEAQVVFYPEEESIDIVVAKPQSRTLR